MRDDLDVQPTMLRIQSVVVRAGGATMLDDVSLSLMAGAPTALIGPNGSGKTTLLRAAMGLIEPASGRIDAACGPRAIVFQKPVMLRRTTAENVAFALAAARRKMDAATINALLAQVGLADLGNRPARKL